MNFNSEIARRLMESDGSRSGELQDAARAAGLKSIDPDVHPDAEELRTGLKVEHEHTTDDDVAEIIAMHHLSEEGMEQYYSVLTLAEELMKAGKTTELLNAMRSIK